MHNVFRATLAVAAALAVGLAGCEKPAPSPDATSARAPAAAGSEARPAGQPAAPAPSAAGNGRDGQADFDFVIGAWSVHNRRLRRPLTGSNEWYEFEGKAVARKLWGGKANVDEFEAVGPAGPIQGLTVRLYDPTSKQWRLYWANRARGALEVPTVGEFKNGRGEFFDHELFEGKSIFVRYVWSDITANACRWEQAFSEDGGKTWEANWTMQFTRTAS